MKKIIVISDNHGDEKIITDVLKKEPHDLAVHAGDYFIDFNHMKQMFNYFVDGNNDWNHEKEIIFKYENLRFLLVHGDSLYAWDENKWINNLRQYGKSKNVDVVIFGHSHKELIDDKAKPIIINPGSITFPRNKLNKKTYAIITIENGKIDIDLKYVI